MEQVIDIVSETTKVSDRQLIIERILSPPKIIFNTQTVQLPYRIDGVYGKGVNAIVVRIIDAANKTYAMRIGRSSREVMNLQNTLVRFKMAPKLFLVSELFPNSTLWLTIMDSISEVLSSYLQRPDIIPKQIENAFTCLMDKKTILRFVHGDMHLENIVILNDGSTLGFIDFDFSLFVQPFEETLSLIDFIPLLGHLRRHKHPWLTKFLVHYCEHTFLARILISNIQTSRVGGFYYQKLCSYIADPEIYQRIIGLDQIGHFDAKKFALEQLRLSFPSIRPPLILQTIFPDNK